MKRAVLNPIGRLMQVTSTIAGRNDGWMNVLTGLGIQNKDKRLAADYIWEPLYESDAEQLFATSDIARRVVSFPTEEGTREWIRLSMRNDGDPEIATAVSDDLERLDAQNKFQQAWEWSRLYGGSGIFLGVDDGKKLFEPLDLGAIRSIRSLTVLNRHELNPIRITTNLMDPNFGKPELFSFTPRNPANLGGDIGQEVLQAAVHHSRILRFDGSSLPRRLSEVNEHWGDSVLTRMLQVLRDYEMSYGSTAHAIQDFRIGVLKLKNLAELIAADEDKAVMTRIQLMNATKSVMSAVALDADSEDYETRATSLQGVKDVLDKMDARLVAATDLPHTIILGNGATGTLSGGGESEDRNVAKYVRAAQGKTLTKPVTILLNVVQAARKGPTRGKIHEDLTWDFVPTWQPTDKEKADVHKTQAEADKIYYEINALESDEIANSRFGGDEFNTETMIDKKSRQNNTPESESPNENVPADPGANDDEDDPTDPENHGHFDPVLGTLTGPSTGLPGPNHVHKRANGTETGPAIPLPDGDHIHSVGRAVVGGMGDTELHTGGAIPIEPVTSLREDVIKEIEGKFFVFSETGKKLSSGYETKAEAQKRLKEIEFFKSKGK